MLVDKTGGRSDRLPALEAIAAKAKAAARTILPLDNVQINDQAHLVAKAAAQSPYEYAIYKETYMTVFLNELRLLTVERMRGN